MQCGFLAVIFWAALLSRGMDRDSQRPKPPSFTPSLQLHIPPSKPEGPVNSLETAPSYWAAYGYSLWQMVSVAWQEKFERVLAGHDVPFGLFDFVLVPPHRLEEAEILALLRKAVQSHFEIHVADEVRTLQVDILTAPQQGRLPALHEVSADESLHKQGRMEMFGLSGSDHDLSGQNVPMHELCSFIEHHEKTWIVDELTSRAATHSRSEEMGTSAQC